MGGTAPRRWPHAIGIGSLTRIASVAYTGLDLSSVMYERR